MINEMQSKLYAQAGVLLLTGAVAAGCARPLPPAERAMKGNVELLRTSFRGTAEGPAAGAAAAVAEPTGWATLRGAFKFNGTPPERPLLNDRIDKDQAVCAPGGRPVPREELVVDSASQGIRDVVIYLTGPTKFPVGDAKWEHPDYAKTREATLDFDQKNRVRLSLMFA